MIVLGYVVAIGLPSVVLVWALAWPVPEAHQTPDRREEQAGHEEL
ncbi:hypothetical protein [Nocardia sp. NPDC051750]